MSFTDLTPIKGKIANNGASQKGILSYDDWNLLVKAVEEMQDYAGEIMGTIDLTNIDSIPASIEDAQAMALDPAHSRWALTCTSNSGKVLLVGVIDIFSDSNGHQISEVLTTNYGMNQGVLDWSIHYDANVFTYHRAYNINSTTLTAAGVNKGTWSAWSEYIPDTITYKINYVENVLTNALEKETQEREEADATLTTNLQKVIDGDVYLTLDEYEALTEKDPDKTYYIYEEE